MTIGDVQSYVPIVHLHNALWELHSLTSTENFRIILGDFNVDFNNDVQKNSLYNQMIVSYGYKQHISAFTTDNRTTIDHIYTNLNESRVQTGVLETLTIETLVAIKMCEEQPKRCGMNTLGFDCCNQIKKTQVENKYGRKKELFKSLHLVSLACIPTDLSHYDVLFKSHKIDPY